ncbi:MAG: anthranilate/aminodeoxychorismate synthase component II [Gammaproteobacteria bacterium RIFCSPHIGHO2_12_FULL_45_9]|nr:MAG: anthranilate/aminodeoxychorismate synthase component II [Gammaproteobacteria bacterium RIFCSPHIGHO2_12_FULL_45_9]
MIVVLDNYDSFVYNLTRYIQELGFDTAVYRSDRISTTEIQALSPEAIVISPGPCTPNEAGISLAVIQQLGCTIPILGICLGHQAIGQAFGARVQKACFPAHGRASAITHAGNGIFEGIHSPLTVGRYHSLIVSTDNFPDELMITSLSDEGEVMSLQHRTYPIYGLQFHPESILTDKGYQLLQNFLKVIPAVVT